MTDERDPWLKVSDIERARYRLPQKRRLVFVEDKPVRYERKSGEWKEPRNA